MTAPKLTTALSFHYNDQNYCRTDGTFACLITSLITLAPQQGTDRPPGNSHIPEVQIKLSRFFLTVEAEPNLPKTQCPSARYVVTFVRQVLTQLCSSIAKET